jgi:hypothetical protein
LIDRRLHESRANRFRLPSTLAEVRDKLAVIADVCFKLTETGLNEIQLHNKSPSRSRASSTVGSYPEVAFFASYSQDREHDLIGEKEEELQRRLAHRPKSLTWTFVIKFFK